jgi:ubiquinone biosynthesis protein COQ9
MKTRELEACLNIIEKEGWKRFSFSKASKDASIPLDLFYEQFSSPSDVIVQLFRLIDQNVLRSLDLHKGLSPKDTLFDILMSRFEASQPFKAVLKSFWEDWMMTSMEVPACACQGLTSMAWMLEAAGLSARGLKGFIRAQGLMALYLLTLKTWLKDDSPDLGNNGFSG